ncbi:hypothetical protein KSS87_001592 [Heliosperma pusillum]|nr:hypothetical protein KSS87_001592 [Heliosperma pusillum]
MAHTLSVSHFHHVSSSSSLTNHKLSSYSSALSLSSNPRNSIHFFNSNKKFLSSPRTKPLTIVSMAPKPGGKAKKVIGVIKLALEAGKATPAPPVGPALGSKGVNIMAFCKDYNARTADKPGFVIPVEITVYDDKSFTFVLKTPPASVLLLKAAGIFLTSSLVTEYCNYAVNFRALSLFSKNSLTNCAGVEKGSKDPQSEKVGKITIEQLRQIATEKLPDLNCTTIESAMRIIAGTAANMGVDIDPPILEKKQKVVV